MSVGELKQLAQVAHLGSVGSIQLHGEWPYGGIYCDVLSCGHGIVVVLRRVEEVGERATTKLRRAVTFSSRICSRFMLHDLNDLNDAKRVERNQNMDMSQDCEKSRYA